MRIPRASLGALVAVMVGCASAGTGATTTPETARNSTVRRTNIIGEQEIEQLQAAPTVQDVIRQARPIWLNNPFSIYVDNSPFAGTLSDLSTGRVKEIQYLSLSEAQARWGSGVRIVILITMKR